MSLASLRLETQSFLNVELASLVPRPFPCTASIDRLQYGNTVGGKKLLVPSTLLQEHTVQESHVRCYQVVQKCMGGIPCLVLPTQRLDVRASTRQMITTVRCSQRW